MKRSAPAFPAVMLLFFCLLCGTAFADASGLPEVGCLVSASADGSTVIYPQTAADGESCLFLPAAADLRQLTLTFDARAALLSTESGRIYTLSGKPFDLLRLFPDGFPAEGGVISLFFGTETFSLRILHSENIPALFLTSGSTETDRLWVELDKENRAEGGSMVLLRADGAPVYDGALKNIKGRGNSTWNYPKKPYQLKLAENADLLETGLDAEAVSTWVLLANYCDATLLHNSISFDIAARLGLSYTSGFCPVDLYYDGMYRGAYLLCEKTEVGEGRVDIPDLESAFEDENPELSDFDRLPVVRGENRCGNLYQYVGGLTSPADLSGGYLLEIDYGDRAEAEKCWFTTAGGNYVVCKSPEYASAEAMTYISELFQQFENAVFGGGTDPESGKSYDELADVDSLVRFYLLTELSMDPDAFRSSCFFYKPAGEEKLYAGPVWDFDSAYGSSGDVFPVEGAVAARNPLVRALLDIPAFREKAAACAEELTCIVDALLSSEDSGLPTLDSYARELAASRSMNARLWPDSASADGAEALSALRDLLYRRVRWLARWLSGNDADEAAPPTAVFFDVSEESWYHDDVLFTVEQGIFNGTSYGYFSPDMAFTRGMAVTILYRMAGEPKVSGVTDVFSDVTLGAWYRKGVHWAAENGIARGYADGSFRPDEKITRQDFVTLFYRWAGSPEASEPAFGFDDTYLVADYARAAVDWAVSAGLLRGDGYGQLLPLDTLTRAQAAALLHRYLCADG